MAYRQMQAQTTHIESRVPEWKSLYWISGSAALLAGLIFRRNLGVEIALFSTIKAPTTGTPWLLLLQDHRLLGLAYLGIFDLVNAVLVGLMLLSLYITLRRVHPGLTLVAAGLGFLGVAVYLGSNTALSMLSLSDQYAAANNEAQRSLLLSSAQTLLALNRFSSPGAHPGSGGYMSLFLIAAAGLIFSTLLMRPLPQRPQFGRWVAITGLIANGLDMMYCLVFPFSSSAIHEQLAVLFIPAAGLFLMAWHILVGVRLLQFARVLPQSEAGATD